MGLGRHLPPRARVSAALAAMAAAEPFVLGDAPPTRVERLPAPSLAPPRRPALWSPDQPWDRARSANTTDTRTASAVRAGSPR
jgi:hypothetical protein